MSIAIGKICFRSIAQSYIIRNNQYPWKINHGFYEAFFVLEGECEIEFEHKIVTLVKHDFFVIEPELKHTSRAEFADVMITCTPPFDIKNVELCE